MYEFKDNRTKCIQLEATHVSAAVQLDDDGSIISHHQVINQINTSVWLNLAEFVTLYMMSSAVGYMSTKNGSLFNLFPLPQLVIDNVRYVPVAVKPMLTNVYRVPLSSNFLLHNPSSRHLDQSCGRLCKFCIS
jgi:hypothetical protein